MRIVLSVGDLRPASRACGMSFLKPDDDEPLVAAEVIGRDDIGLVGLRDRRSTPIRSFSVSTPARQNMSVGGCIPPCSFPFSQGTPARKATSPSPVQSMTIGAVIASLPALLSIMTPRIRSPSMTTPAKVV